MMVNEDYMKYNYAGFWSNQSYKYGVGEVENFVVDKIASSCKNAFEVGIGNGYPYAKKLTETGVMVDGCDLSPVSVCMARRTLGLEYDSSRICIGSLCESHVSKKYDCAYLMRSSWYIEDIYALFSDMTRIIDDGGMLVFDILDNRLLGLCEKAKKYTMSLIYETIGFPEKGDTNFFHDSEKIEKWLKTNGFQFDKYREAQLTGEDPKVNKKILYICRRE